MLHELLEDEVNALYDAFAATHPGVLHSCPCCTDRAAFEELAEYDVRDAPSHLLDMYVSEAVGTAGEARDFRYYLPRILELTLREEQGFYPARHAATVRYTVLSSWSDSHQRALLDFYHAVIQCMIEWEYFDTLADWICAMATSECDIKPVLNTLETSPAAAVAFFAANVPGINVGRLQGLWERDSFEHQAVVEWFYSPAVRKLLHDSFGICLPTWKLN